MVIVFATIVATTSLAAAQTSCEGRVLDATGQLNTSDIVALTELTEELSAVGVRPFVRLLQTTESGIDSWLATSQQQCPAWQEAGERAPDLLVLAVSVGDRQTGTWYGAELAPRLDDTYLSVHEQMADELRGGEYGAAIAVGLSQYIQILGGATPGSRDGPSDQTTSAQSLLDDTDEVAGTATEGTVPQGSSSGSPAAREWLVLLGLAALGGGGWWAVKRYRHQRIAAEVRVVAVDNRAAARTAYVALDQHWAGLVDASQRARDRVATGDSIAVALEIERQQAVLAVQEAKSAYIDAEQGQDPEGTSSLVDLHAARDTWKTVGTAVAAAAREVHEVGGAMAHLEQAETAAAQALAEYEKRRQQADAAVEQAAAQGFVVQQLHGVIQQAETDRVAGQQALDQRLLGDGSTALIGAVQALAWVADQADDLPDRRRRLAATQSDLASQRQMAAGQLELTHRTVNQLRSSYARTVWDPVADVPALAEQELSAVDTALEKALAAADMGTQAFDDAEECLADAGAGLATVNRMTESVAGIAEDIESAKGEWDAERLEATTSLEHARQFAEHNRIDVSPMHLPALQRAHTILTEAERLAGAALPDPLAALHRLREVDSTCDAVLASAQGEKSARDRVRQRARRMIRDAQREVRRAESQSGFGLFGWSAHSKSTLASCGQTLHQATNLVSTDPETAERDAARVERQALDITAEAQRRNNKNSYGSTGRGISFGGSGFSSGSSSSSSSTSGGGGSSTW